MDLTENSRTPSKIPTLGTGVVSISNLVAAGRVAIDFFICFLRKGIRPDTLERESPALMLEPLGALLYLTHERESPITTLKQEG